MEHARPGPQRGSRLRSGQGVGERVGPQAQLYCHFGSVGSLSENARIALSLKPFGQLRPPGGVNPSVRENMHAIRLEHLQQATEVRDHEYAQPGLIRGVLYTAGHGRKSIYVQPRVDLVEYRVPGAYHRHLEGFVAFRGARECLAEPMPKF